MENNKTTCSSCVELRVLIQELKTVKELIEETREEILSAFPQNSIHKPDLDGHRNFHEKELKSAEKFENYKAKMTEKILLWGTGALLGLISLGFGKDVKATIDKITSILSFFL